MQEHMYQRLPYKLLVMLFLFFFYTGCGTLPGDSAKDTGSIIRIESINGYYNDEEGVRTVDVYQDICDVDTDTGDITPEIFTDHFAVVSITNRPLPNTDAQTASTIYLDHYDIVYQPTDTNNWAALPSRYNVDLTDAQGIAPCLPGSTCAASTFTVEMAPLGIKEDLYAIWIGTWETNTINTCTINAVSGIGGCEVEDTTDGDDEVNDVIVCGDNVVDALGNAIYGCACRNCTDLPSIPYTYAFHPQLTYNVHYTFYGENEFGKEFEVEGSTYMYVQNYWLCEN